jgi:hypothetical protein
MSHRIPLPPLAGALLLLGACGIPRLQRVPGSDVARRTSSRPTVAVGAGRSCNGQGTPVGTDGTIGRPGDPVSTCARITTDTVPDPKSDPTKRPQVVP